MRGLLFALAVTLISIPSQIAPQPAFGQGSIEMSGAGAGAAGLGAGFGAQFSKQGSKTQGAKTGGKNAPPKANAIPTEKELDQTVASGTKLQSEKKWGDAEECFKSVLRMINLREGPGSAKSVPTLQQLVSVTTEQGKFKDAIGYQKTVVAFSQRSGTSAKERVALGKLFLLDGNLQQAESTMRTALASGNELSAEQRLEAMRTQVDVLQKLNRADEAKALEAEIAKVSQ